MALDGVYSQMLTHVFAPVTVLDGPIHMRQHLTAPRGATPAVSWQGAGFECVTLD